MPYHYHTPLVDPFFSNKLLTTRSEEKEIEFEKKLTEKLTELYKELAVVPPVYYEGGSTGSELTLFSQSNQFENLVTQLELCINTLKMFCDQHTIIIYYENNHQLASLLFETFLGQLKTDYFSDRRALLYSLGKKYLEIITVLIKDEKINLSFKKLQMNQLLSDEGLTQSCAEGCFTRLQNIAENLKNYGVFDVITLFKRYIQKLSDEIIHRPILMGGDESIARKIPRLMQYSPDAFEVHARNYVLKIFKESFNLEMIDLIQDEYILTIEEFFSHNLESNLMLQNDFHSLYHFFRQEATTAHWIYYLSEEITSAMPKEDYMACVQFLEETALPVFGQDPNFSLGEVLEEETGTLKQKKYLAITLAERLLNEGWLKLDLTHLFSEESLFKQRNKDWSNAFPFEPLTEKAKLFFNNLALSWVQVADERVLITDLLGSQDGIEKIKEIHSDQVALLDNLLQTPEDLAVFFNQIKLTSQENIIDWLKVYPNIIVRSLGYYRSESSTALLDPLFFVAGNLEKQSRDFFLNDIVDTIVIKDLLQEKIRILSGLVANNNVVDIIKGYLRKAISIDFTDFSNFVFYRNNQRISNLPYLNEINFSSVEWINIRFIEDIFKCNFYRIKMKDSAFYGKAVLSVLVESEVLDSDFYESIIRCSFYRVDFSNLDFYQPVIDTNFEDAQLVKLDFKNTIDRCIFKKSRIFINKFLEIVSNTKFNAAQIENTLFNKAVLKGSFDFARLEFVNFQGGLERNSFESAYLIKVNFYEKIIENNFKLVDLDEVNFHNEINQVDFSIAHLKRVTFNKFIFKGIFNQSKQVEVAYLKSITASMFLGATLNSITFDGEVAQCDFASAHLSEVKFLNMLITDRFTETTLRKVKFLSNIYRSDFSGAVIEQSSLDEVVVKNTKFINANIVQVGFSGAYLNKIKFNFSNLEKVIFNNALFEQVSFTNCDLRDISFKNAQFHQNVEFKVTSLSNIDFSYCDLSQIKFERVSIREVSLNKATINTEQLFDLFYYHNVRDFSEVFLSGSVLSSEQFLSIYGQRSLRYTVLSESIFNRLIDLGFKNFQETDLRRLSKDKLMPFYQDSAYHFESVILPENWTDQTDEPVVHGENNQEVSDMSRCFPEGRHGRRQESRCLIDWSDVEVFNREKVATRSFKKIDIDNTIFIQFLRQTTSIAKRKQLLQLAQVFSKTTAQLPGMVTWNNMQKIKKHFLYVDKLVKSVTLGLFYETIFQELLKGDYKNVCLNLGVMSSSILSSKFAKQLLKKGEKLMLNNKIVLGSMLKIMAPFLRGMPISAYIIYDLIHQLPVLKLGNQEALVEVISDGLFLTIEGVGIGITIAEGMGLILDISAITGPLGETLMALIFLGAQGYHAVKKVLKIESLRSLSDWQIFVEGLYALLGIDPSAKIQSLLELDEAYAAYKEKIYRFLEANPNIRRYIVPSINIQFDQKSELFLQRHLFNITHPPLTNEIRMEEDSFVSLVEEEQAGLLFDDMNPLKNHINKEDLFCNPYKVSLDNQTRICDGALVMQNPWSSQDVSHAIWRLGEGRDTGYSYLADTNTFIVNDGYKVYKGSNCSDNFILQGSLIWGLLDGDAGSDTLDLNHYAPAEKVIMIDLYFGTLLYYNIAPLYLRRFERILGRTLKKDIVSATSEIEFIDLRGGGNQYFDEINIPENLLATTKMELMIWPQTIVYNMALQGFFSYVVSVDRRSEATLLTETGSILIFPQNGTLSQNRFLFGCYLHELTSLRFDPSQAKFELCFSSQNNSIPELKTTIFFPPLQAEYLLIDHTEIKIGEQGHFYTFHQSNQSVSELISTYRPFAQRFNMTLVLYQSIDNEAVMIGRSFSEVFYNDVNATKTHLVGNGGNNTYVIAKNTDLGSKNHEVILYDFSQDTGIQTLDLRLLNKNIPGGILENSLLSITLMEIANDLQLLLHLKKTQTDPSLPYQVGGFLRVILRDGLNWYQRLSLLCDQVPLYFIRNQENFWRLQPLSLQFNAQQNIIVITPHDVERDNKIIFDRKLGKYQFYREDSDLWITNWFHYPNNETALYSVLFKEFYRHDKMQSITLHFSDATFKIGNLKSTTDLAPNLKEHLILLEQAAWRALLPPQEASVIENQDISRVRRELKSQSAVQNTFLATDDQQAYFSADESFSIKASLADAMDKTGIANNLSIDALLTSGRIDGPQQTFSSQHRIGYPAIPFMELLQLLNFWVRRYFYSPKPDQSIPKPFSKSTANSPTFFVHNSGVQNDSHYLINDVKGVVRKGS